jgi:transcription elongation regulator 1
MPPVAPSAPAEKKKKKEKPKEKVTVPGTGWQRITTTDGNVFYFEKESKRSEWSVPDEIKEEVAEMEAEEKRLSEEAAKQEREKKEADRLERLREQERVRAEIEEERKKKLAYIAAKRKADAEAKEGQAKKAKTEVQDEEGGEAEQKDAEADDGEEAFGPDGEEDEEEWMKAVAAEFAQADQEKEAKEDKARQETKINTEEAAQKIFAVPEKVNVSLEEQRALFKVCRIQKPANMQALLMEKNISPFAPWDQSLPLFINDPRYILLSSEKDRREVYEEHCRDVGRARRLNKTSANAAAAVESKKADPEKDYKALLREEVTSTRTRWDDFRKKFKKDRRFYAYGRDDREREKAFKTHLKELGERESFRGHKRARLMSR